MVTVTIGWRCYPCGVAGTRSARRWGWKCPHCGRKVSVRVRYVWNRDGHVLRKRNIKWGKSNV